MLKKVLLLMVIFMGFMRLDCEEDFLEVKFKVICNGTATIDGSFTGYYIIDGETPKTFTGTVLSGRTYYFESSVFEDFDDLEISVTRDNYETSLEIKIYEEGDKVKDTTLDADSDSDTTKYYNISLDYEYEEGQDDDSE